MQCGNVDRKVLVRLAEGAMLRQARGHRSFRRASRISNLEMFRRAYLATLFIHAPLSTRHFR